MLKTFISQDLINILCCSDNILTTYVVINMLSVLYKLKHNILCWSDTRLFLIGHIGGVNVQLSISDMLYRCKCCTRWLAVLGTKKLAKKNMSFFLQFFFSKLYILKRILQLFQTGNFVDGAVREACDGIMGTQFRALLEPHYQIFSWSWKGFKGGPSLLPISASLADGYKF